MKKIGLLSDTHSHIEDRLKIVFSDVDEIWHAGDIGTPEVADFLSSLKPFRAVYGNIDGQQLRKRFPANMRFYCEEVNVFMTHMGGYPGHYDRRIREILLKNPPDLFISGHSHILKVMFDNKLNLLHINPGAAGFSGIHIKRTVVRFIIDKHKIKDLEVVELGDKNRPVT